MNISIDLPPDAAEKLRVQAALKGATLEEHLASLARAWAGTNGAGPRPTPATKPLEQWLKEWREFVNSHEHIKAVADDSRESIYEGRGE